MSCICRHNDCAFFPLLCQALQVECCEFESDSQRIFLYVSYWGFTGFINAAWNNPFAGGKSGILKFIYFFCRIAVGKEEWFSGFINNFNTKQLNMVFIIDFKHIIYSNIKVTVGCM